MAAEPIIEAFFDELDKLSATKDPPPPAVISPNGGAKGQGPGTRQYSARPAAAKPPAPVASPKPSAIPSVSPGVTPNTARQASVPPKAPFPADQFAIT